MSASPPENVNEMLLQFEGREDELIETLRTMQKQNVASWSEEASATGSRNKEMRGEVERRVRRVRRIVPDKMGECPAREFG